MTKQRLIDANAEAAWAMENLPEPHSGVVIQFLRDCGTIDPETLPIVRELREKMEHERKICDDLQLELVHVAKERDRAERAVARLIKEDANPCVFCAKIGAECNGFSSDFCDDFEWRSQHDEEPKHDTL